MFELDTSQELRRSARIATVSDADPERAADLRERLARHRSAADGTADERKESEG